MASPDPKYYSLGKGRLGCAERNADGTLAGPMMDMGNVPELKMNVEMEMLDHFSSMSGIKKKDKSIPLSVTPKITGILDEISTENVKKLMLATETAVSQASGTAQTVTATASPGSWIDLGKRSVSGVSITGYTLGEDFTVNADAGFVFITPNSGIAAGTSVTVTFDCAAVEYVKLDGFKRTELEVALIFVSDNPAGVNETIRIKRAVLKLSGDMSYISDEWKQLAFEAEILQAEDGSYVGVDRPKD